jgi:hypothetical protein
LQGGDWRITHCGDHRFKCSPIDESSRTDTPDALACIIERLGCDRYLERHPATLDLDIQQFVRIGTYHVHPVFPQLDCLSIDTPYPVTYQESCALRRTALHQLADDRVDRGLIGLQSQFMHEVAI